MSDTSGLRGDADAAAIEGGERDFVAFAFVAYALGDGYFTVGEDQLAASSGADAKFFFFFAGLESGRALFNDQRGYTLFTFLGMRVDVHDSRVRRAAVGDPRFCAVEDIFVAALDGFRLQRGGVGAGLRFGERVAADFFATRIWLEEILFLLVGAVAMKRVTVKRILHGENYTRGGAAPGNFFDDDGVGDVVEAGAAFRFRERDTGESQLGGFFKGLAREMARFIEFFGERADFRFRELTHGLLQ